jgi:DNA modification methylase
MPVAPLVPTWQTKDHSVQLYLGDCLEILPRLNLSDIGVLLTDPPYGINHPCNYAERGKDKRPNKLAKCINWENVVGDDTPFDPAHLVALGLPTVLWGGNNYASRLPDSSGWLVWDKKRSPHLDQSTCELAWTNCIKGVRIFHHLWDGMLKASEQAKTYHPTQKPVALMDWVLTHRWVPLGKVLDPFMGSGPVGVAAARLERGYIGIEINEMYFNTAKQRIEKECQRMAIVRQSDEEYRVRIEKKRRAYPILVFQNRVY